MPGVDGQLDRQPQLNRVTTTSWEIDEQEREGVEKEIEVDRERDRERKK